VLQPEGRQTLLDSLRPPSGHSLDFAVGTTFSLSLDAMLTAPAAFALFDVGDQTSPGRLEPLQLLDSIRRHADRMMIFCQAGQIAVPAQRRLFAYLEKTIVPVSAPQGGVFHPKVWVLRFVGQGKARYRILCASRNLTFDRCWDTILRLDSTDEAREGVDASGVETFLRALPSMARRPLSRARVDAVDQLASELAAVSFALPAGVESVAFHPLGFGEAQEVPFPASCSGMMVVSPFLGTWLLEKLPATTGRSVLVSRPEELDALPADALRRFSDVLHLDPDAAPLSESLADDDAGLSPTPGNPSTSLSGLHAKLYVFEEGRKVRLLTGSANASRAAFSTNVELLAELVASSKNAGIAALLGGEDEDATTLRRLLVPYAGTPEGGPTKPPAEDRLDGIRRAFANVGFTATIEGGSDSYVVRYTSDEPLPVLPDDVLCRCWPITLRQAETGHGVRGGSALDAPFTLSFEALTSFLAFQLRDAETETRFVVTCDLVGEPEDRRSRLLRLLLGDAERFLRYLLLLLSDEQSDRFDLASLLAHAEPEDEHGRGPPLPSIPLLETLLRTLHLDPQRLRHVEQLVGELGLDDQFLPPQFEEIWSPIWTVAEELMR
jgi:hypothetical protein